MAVILNSLIFIYILFWLFTPSYFKLNGHIRIFKEKLSNIIKQVISFKASFWVVYLLFYILFFCNLTGNIPLRSIPSLFYSQTFTLSFLFWFPIIICVFVSQFKSFIAHLLPYGSPTGLIFILPLIELFSQLIRPFTLIVRLRTNLSRGHIILYYICFLILYVFLFYILFY